MKNVLVVGTNSRPVACSAKKMGNTIYSVDYFCTSDLVRCSDYLRCILNQIPYESCGYYIERFDQKLLETYVNEVIDDVDCILCSAGAMPDKFPESKVIGNKKIAGIENKYNLYNLLKDKFNVPETFLVSSYAEAAEIVKSKEDKKFLVKPIVGAGGKGIRRFEETNENTNFNGMMLQELIEGQNVSASVLSTKNEAKAIFTSRQILGEDGLGQPDEFAYCGNVVPFIDDPEVKKTAEDAIMELSLLGSNGVDMIHTGEDIYIIEVNPRFQGTFECAEAVLGINMVDAHVKACNGTIIEIPEPNKFAVKMVIFAKRRSIAGHLDFDGVYDIPERNVIIEKDEPAATVIASDENLEKAIYKAKRLVEKVYKELEPFPEKILARNINV
ncbi:ATP-grasp domain-containing protein [Methanobacterium sp.]|uniref:ATP-grasp domain-containing protein n=1 Tax=Methanobacterium sp. TaxID=2164 RepID=UPI003C790187